MSAPVLPGLFTVEPYPMGPGAKEPGQTSAQAAQAVPAATLRSLVHAALAGEGPMTADEMAAQLGIDRLAIRPRFSELYALGLIEKTQTTRKNISGHAARVWRVRG